LRCRCDARYMRALTWGRIESMTHASPISLIDVPEGYSDWLAELKECIHAARKRTALAVNRELV
jgi:hypothetical protein